MVLGFCALRDTFVSFMSVPTLSIQGLVTCLLVISLCHLSCILVLSGPTFICSTQYLFYKV